MNPLIAIPWNNKDYPWKEEHLQAAAVQSLWLKEDLGLLTFAADMNAGKRSSRERSLAKLTGMRAGEPDLRLYLKGGKLLFLELKKLDGYLSKEQKNRHNLLKELGFNVIVLKAKTPKEMVDLVENVINQYCGS